MHNLSDQQRQKLLKNPNVEKITDKFVVYTSGFKIKAVELFLEGKSANQIFLEAQIPIHFFKEEYPRFCIKRWKKKYQEQGAKSLEQDHRGAHGKGGRPKKENIDELTYDELLAVVEIQREVIEDLKKRNALAKRKRLKS